MKQICHQTAITLPSCQEVQVKAEGVCPVHQMLQIVTDAHQASCGLGVMCRDGLYQLRTILTDIVEKSGQSDDLALIKDLCEVIVTCNECDLSVSVAKLLLASLEAHTEEWTKHIESKQCSEKICIYTLYVAPNLCTGCEKCAQVCKAQAIRGGNGLIHIIDSTRCTLCGECESACPSDCVQRAGQYPPRCPEEPIPVGTFSTGLGLRRRRPGVRSSDDRTQS